MEVPVRRFPTTVVVIVSSLVAPSVRAQQPSTVPPFDWTGPIPAGAELRLESVRGDIRVSAASGDRASVHADVRGRGHRAARIVFDVIPNGNSVTICARWADDPACTARGMHDQDENNDDDGGSASANFTVQLPRSARLRASTGNGLIDVAGTGSDVRVGSGNGAVRVMGASGIVDASSGNGDVTVEGAGGPVTASTGNGAVRAYTAMGPVNVSTGNGVIDVRMDRLGARSDMAFSTGNGDVTLAVPSTFAADLDADTGHGSIRSDFQLTVNGRIDPSHIRGVIGTGGPRIHLSSGNGDLILRKL
jgi:Putative adhesin